MILYAVLCLVDSESKVLR